MCSNATVWLNTAADKSSSIHGCVLMIGALLLAGCVPLPTVPHTLGVGPDKAAFDSLKVKAADRADTLLLLGDPSHRLDNDRFLMYEWNVAYGYLIVGGPMQAYPIPVTAPHYLCLEFGPNSQLVRREHLIGLPYAKSDRAIKRCTERSEEQDGAKE